MDSGVEFKLTTLILGAGGPIGCCNHLCVSRGRAPSSRRFAETHRRSKYRARRSPYEYGRTYSNTHLKETRSITTIIDVIAYTEADTLPLLSAIDGRVERYVMLSSADVYRNYGLLHHLETGTPNSILTEDAPLRRSRLPYRGENAASIQMILTDGWTITTRSRWKQPRAAYQLTGPFSACQWCMGRSGKACTVRLDNRALCRRARRKSRHLTGLDTIGPRHTDTSAMSLQRLCTLRCTRAPQTKLSTSQTTPPCAAFRLDRRLFAKASQVGTGKSVPTTRSATRTHRCARLICPADYKRGQIA